MLTQRQHQVLVYIDGFAKECGYPPSYEQIRDQLGFASRSGVGVIIRALEERGFISYTPHAARSIEVIRMPGQEVPALTPAQYAFYQAARNAHTHEGCINFSEKQAFAQEKYALMIAAEHKNKKMSTNQ